MLSLLGKIAIPMVGLVLVYIGFKLDEKEIARKLTPEEEQSFETIREVS